MPVLITGLCLKSSKILKKIIKPLLDLYPSEIKI